jgi:hypothetical protein
MKRPIKYSVSGKWVETTYNDDNSLEERSVAPSHAYSYPILLYWEYTQEAVS